MKKYAGYVLILFGTAIVVTVIYKNSHINDTTRVFSSYNLLASSWVQYKSKFINQDGRVIDYSQNNITTSEGQSYAMLRAVWMDDKQTFDTVWNWTTTNMRRETDALFGWKWGKLKDTTYGFLENGGENSAADANSDIALALILAGKRWQEKSYTDQAKVILHDHWEVETATVSGKNYQLAGNWAQDENRIIVNPSYFSPYSWEIFAQVDKEHDWKSLISPAYALLNDSGTAPLDKQTGIGLPPDWVAINKVDGNLSATNLPDLDTDYSYDALRTPWRVALDYRWNNRQEAKEYLLKQYEPLKKLYSNLGYVPGQLAHDGDVINTAENPSLYAAAIGYFQLADKSLANKMYKEKIARLYSNDESGFSKEIPYYEQNWLWFGAAMYHDYLKAY